MPARAGWFAAAGLGLAAAALVLFSTPLGIGVGYDSYFYLTAAESLLSGEGFGRISAEGRFLPLTHFPPLYPTVLAGTSWLTKLEISAGARGLSALLLGLNVSGLILVVRAAGARLGWSLAIAVLAALAPPLFERHLWAMSEPLFFLLLLAAFACLASYVHSERPIWLLAAAVSAGLSYLTRYSGLALIVSGIASLLVLGHQEWRMRFRRAAVFGGVSALLVLPWLARNMLVAGNVTNRRLSFHMLPPQRLAQAGRTLADWLPLPWLPGELRLAIVLAGLLALTLWGMRRVLQARRSRASDLGPALIGAAGLFAAAYVALLALSLLFFDASTRLDDRILSPLYLVAVLVLFVLLGTSRPRVRRRTLWGGAVLLFLLASGLNTVEIINNARLNGLGFHSRAWRNSGLVAAVSALPDGTLLYSNEAFPLNYLTGRPVYSVPERIDPVLAEERRNFRVQLDTMRARLEAEGGALVLFHPQSLRPEMPSLDELTQGLSLVSSYPDGDIYRPREQ